jgi:hypothetical protein
VKAGLAGGNAAYGQELLLEMAQTSLLINQVARAKSAVDQILGQNNKSISQNFIRGAGKIRR